MTPELYAVLCLIGLIVFGGLGLFWLREDLKRDATIRRRLRGG
jgi:hypothetical protein